VTAPATLTPLGPVTVNVEVLMVAGFIALLNVAVITAVLGQTRVEPLGGVARVTVGGVRGSPGFPAFGLLSGSPHPAVKLSNRSTVNQILRLLCVRIQCLFFSAQLLPYLVSGINLN
jgi:hypothetical protein